MNWRAVRIYGGVAWFSAIAVGFAWGSWHQHRRISVGPTWPTVQGAIYDSRVRPCNKGAMHAPQILYRYIVDGKFYNGEVYFKTSHCGTEHQAEEIVGAYPQTFTFEVHVNPKDASESLVLGP